MLERHFMNYIIIESVIENLKPFIQTKLGFDSHNVLPALLGHCAFASHPSHWARCPNLER